MNRITSLILLSLLWATAQATVFTDEQNQTIEQMGKLNGTALSCRYFDQVKHIKKALVEALPKRRELGRQFEAVTDKTYRELMANKTACPTADEFASNVDAGIQQLNKAFSNK